LAVSPISAFVALLKASVTRLARSVLACDVGKWGIAGKPYWLIGGNAGAGGARSRAISRGMSWNTPG
jgi:hypothetical protein